MAQQDFHLKRLLLLFNVLGAVQRATAPFGLRLQLLLAIHDFICENLIISAKLTIYRLFDKYQPSHLFLII